MKYDGLIIGQKACMRMSVCEEWRDVHLSFSGKLRSEISRKSVKVARRLSRGLRIAERQKLPILAESEIANGSCRNREENHSEIAEKIKRY